MKEPVNTIRASLTPVTTPSSASASPMAIPAPNSGEVVECSGFILQVLLFIEMQPQKFVSERSKVVISHLMGRALLWAQAIWNSQGLIINYFDTFTNHFKEVFGLSTWSHSVQDQLKCGYLKAFLSNYTLHFHTLAATSSWNETALLTAYHQGLDPLIRA